MKQGTRLSGSHTDKGHSSEIQNIMFLIKYEQSKSVQCENTKGYRVNVDGTKSQLIRCLSK